LSVEVVPISSALAASITGDSITDQFSAGFYAVCCLADEQTEVWHGWETLIDLPSGWAAVEKPRIVIGCCDLRARSPNTVAVIRWAGCHSSLTSLDSPTGNDIEQTVGGVLS